MKEKSYINGIASINQPKIVAYNAVQKAIFEDNPLIACFKHCVPYTCVGMDNRCLKGVNRTHIDKLSPLTHPHPHHSIIIIPYKSTLKCYVVTTDI